jgi:beta-lactam-binding protein with PASTA domain
MRTLTLLAFVLAGCARLPAVTASDLRSRAVVDMPDLLGKTLAEGRAELASRGFHGEISIDDHRCYVDMPAGKICGTNPAAGAKVALHRGITIHVR